MSEELNIKEEAIRYFTKHYPLASREEIDKQVNDWQNKSVTSKSLVEFFKNRVGKVENKKILDVGFGNGGVAVAFNLAGGIVSGIDIDHELKAIADRNVSQNQAKADLRVYNGIVFPFDNDYFDYITSFSVLEHVTCPEKVLNEMLRVLRPGGRILLTLPNKYYPKETHNLVYFVSYMPRGLANIYLKLLKRSPLEHDNLHFYSYFNIIRMLRKTDHKYEIVYKDLSNVSFLKKFIIFIFKKLNIHYTIFLKQLIFIIEKK